MKLSEAIRKYVEWKQSLGFPYDGRARSLRAFLRHTGNLPVDSMTKSQSLSFLDLRKTSAQTWRAKYRTLKAFFQYWKLRGQIDTLPMPPPRAGSPSAAVPRVLSRPELRRLLRAAQRNRRESQHRDDLRTLHTMFLFLYGTGARIAEAVTLTRSDVDLRHAAVTLRQAFTCRTRTIPIGRSLQHVLKEYDHSIVRTRHGCRNFFVNEDGRAVRFQALARNFRRCCFDAKIFQQGGVGSQPCLRDLRRTFAVHCLEAWLREGRDLRGMLPLLATYMGLAKLTSTEAYLSMTPERFRGSLRRLKGFRAPYRETRSTLTIGAPRVGFEAMATDFTMSRQDVMKYWSKNQYAGMMIFSATQDYVAARCCILNALFSGFMLASQAIERVLKALIFLENGEKMRTGHDLFALKQKLKAVKDYDLDKCDELLKRLHDHYQSRYYDNVTTGKGASSEELPQIDALWLELIEKVPVPDEAKYRIAFFSFIFEPNPHWRNDYWLTTANKGLRANLERMRIQYEKVRNHLYPEPESGRPTPKL